MAGDLRRFDPHSSSPVRLLAAGAPLPAAATTDPLVIPRAGDVTLRVLANQPNMANLYRLDQLVAAMMHAKTAVADGRWARVGSINLNVTSWIGNYELDIAIEDSGFAGEIEAMYEDDLMNATEILLSSHNRVRPTVTATHPENRGTFQSSEAGSRSRYASGTIKISCSSSSAISGDRSTAPIGGTTR